MIIQKWFDSNYLRLNLNKTKYTMFRNSGCVNIELDSVQISSCNEFKFLGLHIQSDLKWHTQTSILAKKLASACYALRVTTENVGTELAKTVYHALFESHLRYAVPCWGFATQTELDVLFILQKRAMRIITKSQYDAHCRPLFKQSRILSLYSFFVLEMVCLIHKHKRIRSAKRFRYCFANTKNGVH